MWVYRQSTGMLVRVNGTVTAFIGVGHSGCGAGLNNPAMQAVHGIGPIPCGVYTIGSPRVPSARPGAPVLPLDPDPSGPMFGRTALFARDDIAATNPKASGDCVVFKHLILFQIAASADRQLEVLP